MCYCHGEGYEVKDSITEETGKCNHICLSRVIPEISGALSFA